MTLQHTAGPWEAVHIPSLTNIHDGWWRIPGVAHIESGEANAKLIAAAPDLLRVLEEMCGTLPPDNMLIERARAAIAKARGRTT